MTYEQMENINEIFELAQHERERHNKKVEEKRQRFMRALGIKRSWKLGDGTKEIHRLIKDESEIHLL